MASINAGILGTGHSYPAGILTNADLEKIVETSDDWITSRTGIARSRRGGFLATAAKAEFFCDTQVDDKEFRSAAVISRNYRLRRKWL